METTIKDALSRGGVIEITTRGAKTGLERRIEINFTHLDGNYYITGRPGRKRDWLANLKANPDFTIHLKHGLTANIPATAQLITDGSRRSEVLYRILTEDWENEPAKAEHILPRWVESAPLVEFTVS